MHDRASISCAVVCRIAAELYVVRDANGQQLAYVYYEKADDQRPSCSAKMRRDNPQDDFCICLW